ncbi:MAG TPA: ribulokinase [Tepidisphaeraceae bacterium]|jgi:L-ribulokinase
MGGPWSLGLDFGTNSVRALIVDIHTGAEVGTAIWNYTHGEAGIILDRDRPHLARQHPEDYLTGIRQSITSALTQAAKTPGFSSKHIIGIGVDTTGSTPMPVDRQGQSLTSHLEFHNNPDAMAWLWKDHTSHAEAEEITALASRMRPHYLAKCGGRYSSEWFWAKILHCARTAPKVFAAAYSWVEIADWIPAILTGNTRPEQVTRGVCAAGHKAMFNPAWDGYPDEEFLKALHPDLPRLRPTLQSKAANVSQSVGGLNAEWAMKLGLPEGTPVAVGAFDAHLGAIGAGIGPGVLVKIMGTSTCDIMVSLSKENLADIPGLCGIVPESVLPDHFGLEAGQSAVGDIFNWVVNFTRGNADAISHESLTAAAEKLQPGESALLALDWHNGNRTVLVDQRLTGTIVGLSLHTTPAEVYRAMLEATAFGSRMIVERVEEYGVKVQRVVNCGGIATRNPLTMQIYADVFNRPVAVSRSTQTCALGAAIAGAVVAGKSRGGHANFADAISAMTGVQEKIFVPNPVRAAIYERLFALYRKLHDAFGIRGTCIDLSNVMKELLDIRDACRSN